MKNRIRVISALLLAALLGSAVAAPVSAKTIFVNQDTARGATSQTATEEKETSSPGTGNSLSGIPVRPVTPEEKKQTPNRGCTPYPYNPQPYYPSSYCPQSYYPSSYCPQSYYPSSYCPQSYYPQYCDTIWGGRYYSPADARAEIQKYLANNSYDLLMYQGQSRFISKDTYLVSSKPAIVSYDANTGRLTAHKTGTADVVVYTKGGVPVARLDVDVMNPTIYDSKLDTLTLTVDNWNPSVGGTAQITVKSDSGKVYDDIAFRVMQGWKYVTLNEKTGSLTGDKNGLAVIRAYSKSNDSVYGETLVYVGNLTSGIYDGYWTTDKDGIHVSRWNYDVRDCFCDHYASVNGWIRSSDGIFLPIIVPLEAVAKNADGSTSTAYLVNADSVAYLNLLRYSYGSKSDLKSAIALYNTNRYDASKLPVTADELTVLFLAQLLGYIK